MKRKLDENDIPTPVEVSSPSEENAKERTLGEINENAPAPFTSIKSFKDFGLDPRLIQGVAHAGLSKPTEVQTRAIPIIIEGKDILGQ